MILRHLLGSAVLWVKFASMFVDVAGLSKIIVLNHPANLTWQKLNTWVIWESVGVTVDIKGVYYLKPRVKNKEVKDCYMSNDAAHTILECRIVLLSKGSLLSCFQPWQLKPTKKGSLQRRPMGLLTASVYPARGCSHCLGAFWDGGNEGWFNSHSCACLLWISAVHWISFQIPGFIACFKFFTFCIFFYNYF